VRWAVTGLTSGPGSDLLPEPQGFVGALGVPADPARVHGRGRLPPRAPATVPGAVVDVDSQQLSDQRRARGEEVDDVERPPSSHGAEG